jgi:hypothetical protein
MQQSQLRDERLDAKPPCSIKADQGSLEMHAFL